MSGGDFRGLLRVCEEADTRQPTIVMIVKLLGEYSFRLSLSSDLMYLLSSSLLVEGYRKKTGGEAGKRSDT